MIDSKRLGLAGGILTALCMLVRFIFSMGAMEGQMITPMPMYPGLELTGGGGFILGLIISFVHGFIVLFVLGWLYNRLPHSRKR